VLATEGSIRVLGDGIQEEPEAKLGVSILRKAIRKEVQKVLTVAHIKSSGGIQDVNLVANRGGTPSPVGDQIDILRSLGKLVI
jgi:hypothetical protein